VRTKVLVCCAALAGLAIVALWSGQAISQQKGGAAPEVAAVDLSKILKEHKQFNALMEQMKGEVQKAEADLNKARESIANLEKEIVNKYKPGTPEFKKAEEDLFRRKNEFNYQATTVKRDLMEKETAIYYQVNKQVSTAVEGFAKQYGIVMVLRYNSDTAQDPNDRQNVARELSKAIIYIRPDLDITPYIVQALNQQTANLPMPPRK